MSHTIHKAPALALCADKGEENIWLRMAIPDYATRSRKEIERVHDPLTSGASPIKRQRLIVV